MSEIQLNVLDAGRAISGKIHASVADSAVAALSSEPETIDELQDAMARFIEPDGGGRPFDTFYDGAITTPWDAGIIFIDLAARVVAVESTYSMPAPEGQVSYHNGKQATRVNLPYCVPDDWLFVDSIDEYDLVRDGRLTGRMADQPFDARPVLYGMVVKFIVEQCLAARDARADDPVTEIHARWLSTPRDDLHAKSPREILLAKREFIDIDLQSRELQWSFLDRPAPPLKQDSAAYRCAGFGTHEVVTYYNLVRHLLTECWNHVCEKGGIRPGEEEARLEQVKTEWLERPDPEFGGRSPAHIMECERRRIPLIMSAEEIDVEDDCPLCKAMAEDYRPTFWHLEGSDMDDGFAFSFHLSAADWEDEERSRRQFDEEFEREWKQRNKNGVENENPLAGEGMRRQ